MRGSAVLLVAVVLPACAEATTDKKNPGKIIDAPEGSDPDGDNPSIDAPNQQVDTGPVMVTLSQTPGATVASDMSIACGGAGYTGENSWYRVFDLAAFSISNTLHVSKVTFGVQESGGTQTVQVKIGTYSGAVGGDLNTGSITPINSSTVNVPAVATGSPTTMDAAITGDIPAGSKLIVEIYTPDHNGTTTYFYLGGTAASETATGYIKAAGCGISNPTPVKNALATAGNLVIDVVGTH